MDFAIAFRAFKLADASFVNSMRQMEEMENLIGGAKRPVSLERDTKWIQDILMGDSQHAIYFAITYAGADDIIGYTSISEIDYRNGTCFWSGIKLHPSTAGKGFGSQVALWILRYVFEELRMERCKGECLEHHASMLKILHKVGFRQEGLMRSSIFKSGKPQNQWLLSVIKPEYQEIKRSFAL